MKKPNIDPKIGQNMLKYAKIVQDPINIDMGHQVQIHPKPLA